MPFPRVKGHNYDMANRIPFVAHWPRGIVQPGRRVAEFISLIDLAPTMLEVFGIKFEASGMSPITGRSFGDLLQNKPTQTRETVIIGRERNDVLARPGRRMDWVIRCAGFARGICFTCTTLPRTAGRAAIRNWV